MTSAYRRWDIPLNGKALWSAPLATPNSRERCCASWESYDCYKHAPLFKCNLHERIDVRIYLSKIIRWQSYTDCRRHHFYWFIESEQDPDNAPVVLWLNGGPLASSLLGLFTENGPYRVDSNGIKLTMNQYSWNKVANMLYMETPVGVGHSYDENVPEPHSDNNSTMMDNYFALESFLDKYPHLKKNAFYITGESYGGVYVPMLANEHVAIINAYNIYDNCPLEMDPYNISQAYNTNNKLFKQAQNVKQQVNCPHSGHMNYMNRADVRQALHVRSGAPKWTSYKGPQGYKIDDRNGSQTFVDLIEKYRIAKILVYNGDFDSVCDFITDGRFVEGLGYKTTDEYRPWTVDGKPDGVEGGFVQHYEKGISFLTVRGSGHMVPTDRPEAALQIIQALIGYAKL
ncbi:unnamed protein product [Oppiella nova]|nr:unnamed protein product [Oppiella nova]CAG2165565.1 unnamed protein product [Oppiella nova]